MIRRTIITFLPDSLLLILGAWQTAAAAGIIYQNNTSSIYCYLPDRKKKHRGHKASSSSSSSDEESYSDTSVSSSSSSSESGKKVIIVRRIMHDDLKPCTIASSYQYRCLGYFSLFLLVMSYVLFCRHNVHSQSCFLFCRLRI